MLTSLECLHLIVQIFKAKNIHFTLGGSTLLYAHNLITEFHDWDLTVEALLKEVLSVINGFNYILTPSNEIFKSQYLIKVSFEDCEFDIIDYFAILKKVGTIHQVPVIVNGAWIDVPLSDLQEWKIAYDLMGRQKYADLIVID